MADYTLRYTGSEVDALLGATRAVTNLANNVTSSAVSANNAASSAQSSAAEAVAAAGRIEQLIIDNPGATAIDSTLTLPGAAAESKTVGDKITSLNGDILSVAKGLTNLFDNGDFQINQRNIHSQMNGYGLDRWTTLTWAGTVTVNDDNTITFGSSGYLIQPFESKIYDGFIGKNTIVAVDIDDVGIEIARCNNIPQSGHTNYSTEHCSVMFASSGTWDWGKFVSISCDNHTIKAVRLFNNDNLTDDIVKATFQYKPNPMLELEKCCASTADTTDAYANGYAPYSDGWLSNKTYAVNDVCIYKNKMWRCLVSNSGQTPAENEYWTNTNFATELNAKLSRKSYKVTGISPQSSLTTTMSLSKNYMVYVYSDMNPVNLWSYFGIFKFGWQDNGFIALNQVGIHLSRSSDGYLVVHNDSTDYTTDDLYIIMVNIHTV